MSWQSRLTSSKDGVRTPPIKHRVSVLSHRLSGELESMWPVEGFNCLFVWRRSHINRLSKHVTEQGQKQKVTTTNASSDELSRQLLTLVSSPKCGQNSYLTMLFSISGRIFVLGARPCVLSANVAAVLVHLNVFTSPNFPQQNLPPLWGGNILVASNSGERELWYVTRAHTRLALNVRLNVIFFTDCFFGPHRDV